MIPHMNRLHVFIEMKQKKKKKWKKKSKIKIKKRIQNGRLKKRSFSSSANSQYFLLKLSWIGPWVGRIDWCEGHLCDSTYMVVRLSDISSKTGRKCFFCVFRLFLSLCQTASRLEIVGEWVMKRRPFWIKILHKSPILLGRFCDKKEWNLLSVLCSLWVIYAWENLQCVFSLQTLQCAMFWFSLKLA